MRRAGAAAAYVNPAASRRLTALNQCMNWRISISREQMVSSLMLPEWPHSWQALWEQTEIFFRFYDEVTRTVVTGPRSLTYLIPLIVLPVSLMVPPHILSHRQLAWTALPTILLSSAHASFAIGCPDVTLVGEVLWGVYLLAFKDPRRDFGLVHRNDVRQSAWLGLKPQASVKAVRPRHETKSNGARLRITDNVDQSSGQSHGINSKIYYEVVDGNINVEGYPKKLLPRWIWINVLMISIRLSGWLIGDERHDSIQPLPKKVMSRLDYFLNTLPIIITATISQYISTLVAFNDAYFMNPSSVSIFSPYAESTSMMNAKDLVFLKSLQSALPPPILRSLTIGLFCYSLVALQCTLLAPMVLLTNYMFNMPPDEWSPQNLIPAFGSFTKGILGRGVSGFWGTWWHQYTRIFLSAPGIFVAEKLGFKAASSATYAAQVFSAFFFSGIMHASMVPIQPRNLSTGTTPNMLRLHLAAFFWIQPIAILLEFYFKTNHVHGHSAFGAALIRILRLCWVTIWLTLTLPFLALPFADMNIWHLAQFSPFAYYRYP